MTNLFQLTMAILVNGKDYEKGSLTATQMVENFPNYENLEFSKQLAVVQTLKKVEKIKEQNEKFIRGYLDTLDVIENKMKK